MKKEKKKWEPEINCFLKNGTPIKPKDIVIPDNHPVYYALTKINEIRLSGDVVEAKKGA